MPPSNDEIRAKILRLHYDLEMQNPKHPVYGDKLKEAFPDTPENLLTANLLYLWESRLLTGRGMLGTTAPLYTMITAEGINVVENPTLASKFQINVQVLQIGTVYGQVAQASEGSSVIQTQTYTFNDLKKIVGERKDINAEERQQIGKILDDLENASNLGTLTKAAIDKAKEALAKYGWLIPPLLAVLKATLGLS